MTRFFHFFSAPTTQQANSSDGVHLVVQKERPHRRIRRLDRNQDSDFQNFPRFGPLYASDEGPMLKGLKEMAWQHVLEKTGGDRDETTEKYLSAIRDVEREAMDCYEDLTAVTSETEFRWMMLKDGCFLLQLAIMLLGGSSILEYPPDHILFGTSKKVDTQRWTKSMFYVGNQIPLVVLGKLVDRPFFRDKLLPEARKWEEPSDLYKKALHKFLLFPSSTFPTALQRSTPPKSADGQKTRRPPSDLLHGLQSLVVYRLMKGQVKDNTEDIDLELGDNDDVDDDDARFPSATELHKEGIHFKNVKGNGNGKFHFTPCKIWPVLSMPTFTIDDQTLLVFENVINYERTQQPKRKDRRELCSYLKFMSELVVTNEDVKILAEKEIIEADSRYREKLPRILRAFSEGESSDYLRQLRFQVNEYSQPSWWKYKEIISLAFFLTVVQTVFAILSYVHDLTSS